MVNEEATIAKTINGYEFICMADGSLYPDAIEFYPHSGKECANGFFWELQHEVYDILLRSNQEVLLKELLSKNFLCDQFNFANIPSQLRFLLENQEWFYKKIYINQNKHKAKGFCGGFASFIDSLYNETKLPPIAKKPIQFCPFCGVKLGIDFNKNDWWVRMKRKKGYCPFSLYSL